MRYQQKHVSVTDQYPSVIKNAISELVWENFKKGIYGFAQSSSP